MAYELVTNTPLNGFPIIDPENLDPLVNDPENVDPTLNDPEKNEPLPNDPEKNEALPNDPDVNDPLLKEPLINEDVINDPVYARLPDGLNIISFIYLAGCIVYKHYSVFIK